MRGTGNFADVYNSVQQQNSSNYVSFVAKRGPVTRKLSFISGRANTFIFLRTFRLHKSVFTIPITHLESWHFKDPHIICDAANNHSDLAFNAFCLHLANLGSRTEISCEYRTMCGSWSDRSENRLKFTVAPYSHVLTKRERARGGRFVRLMQSRFKTTLLNSAFVRRAKKRYSCKEKNSRHQPPWVEKRGDFISTNLHKQSDVHILWHGLLPNRLLSMPMVKVDPLKMRSTRENMAKVTKR